jgi:hypothetical protein
VSTDVPDAEGHVLNAAHFALDTAADRIAQLVGDFMNLSSAQRPTRALQVTDRCPKASLGSRHS